MNYMKGIEVAGSVLAFILFLMSLPTLISMADLIEEWANDGKGRKWFLIVTPVVVAFLLGAF